MMIYIIEEFVEFLANGSSDELNAYYQNFVENGGNMSLLAEISKLLEKVGVEEALAKYGITGTKAAVLFALLYMSGKGVLAISTGGLGLVLP